MNYNDLTNKQLAEILFQLSTEVRDRLKDEAPLTALRVDKYLSDLGLRLFDLEASEGYETILQERK